MIITILIVIAVVYYCDSVLLLFLFLLFSLLVVTAVQFMGHSGSCTLRDASRKRSCQAESLYEQCDSLPEAEKGAVSFL